MLSLAAGLVWMLSLPFLGVFSLVVAVAPGYVLFAMLVDRVTIRLDDKTITSTLGPFRIWPKKVISLREIENVVAAQHVSAKKGWSESTNVAWYVVAHTKEGDVAISRLLRREDEAEYVASLVREELARHFPDRAESG